MALKSMKLSEEDKKEETMPSVMDRPSYPYGLKIHLSEECVERLGMNEAPQVGSKFMMLAQVEVVDVHQTEKGDDKKYYSMGMQITDMDLQKVKKEESKDTASTLYGESEG